MNVLSANVAKEKAVASIKKRMGHLQYSEVMRSTMNLATITVFGAVNLSIGGDINQAYQNAPSGHVRLVADCRTGITVKPIPHKETVRESIFSTTYPKIQSRERGEISVFLDENKKLVHNQAKDSDIFLNPITDKKIGIIQKQNLTKDHLQNLANKLASELKSKECNSNIGKVDLRSLQEVELMDVIMGREE